MGLFSKIASAKAIERLPWNKFAMNLEQDQPANKSAIVSGLSIWIALAMLESGAENQTKQELREVLDLKDFKPDEIETKLKVFTSSKEFELSIANSMWPSSKHSYHKEYIAEIEKYFKGELHSLNYANDPEAARKEVNSWVEKKTNSKIKEILAPGKVTTKTLLLIANAIYFKAKWLAPFSALFSKEAAFHTSEGSTRKVLMMNQTQYHPYYEDKEVQALRMDYQGGEVCFLAVLPRPSVKMSHADFDKLETILESLKEQNVEVSIPRFKIEAELVGLSSRLQKLGIKRLFDPGQAELGKIMAPTKEILYVSDIIHKAFIEVDEAGTEAAAATVSEMRATGAPPLEKKKVFRADRPFRFYVIHKNTNSVLFSGQYF